MRASDTRALLRGVSDDALIVVASMTEAHETPVRWEVTSTGATGPGEPQSVVLWREDEDDMADPLTTFKPD